MTDTTLQFSDAYDQGKLATYLYMAVIWKPLENHDLLAALHDVIWQTSFMNSTLQLHSLHILEIAVKHVHKTTSPSSDWLRKWSDMLQIITPGDTIPYPFVEVDYWVLLHLDTLLAPKPYLLPEEVGKLEWSDIPEKVYIAKAWLDLYDSLADTGHEVSQGPKPDPGLLRVFLWSKDRGVCTRTFKWCLNLVYISQSDAPGGVNSTSMFTPEPLGYQWVEHFINVLCDGRDWEWAASRRFLISDLVPKWPMLPLSWRCDFASALLFSIMQPLGKHGLPAYQCLTEDHRLMPINMGPELVPFLATLLNLVKSSLTWVSLTSLENWLARLPEGLENQDAHAKLRHILATRKPQLTLEFFAAELPMAVTVPSL